MNILHLEASSGWGGQEMRILRESIGMRARGYNVSIAVMKGGQLAQHARKAGFRFYELNFKRGVWPACLLRLLNIFRKERVDLVNTHSSLDSWIGGMAAKLAKVKVIRTRHLSTPIKKGWNSRFVYGKLADYVVTTCASIAPVIAEQSGKQQELCSSIATGVDPEALRVDAREVASFRKKVGVAETDFLVGTACVMRSWKGIDDLLKAADILRDVPNLKFLLVGGGHVERHKSLAKELKLENTVIFTGHLENPFPALAALDIFTLLSTAHEGVSQAILQAGFLAKPLISTVIGGLGEVCIDQLTGINVPPFAPVAVAKAILTIKDSPLLRHQFGEKAHAHVLALGAVI
jgi:glycosyltransferase involved in cell wall biosynthesis